MSDYTYDLPFKGKLTWRFDGDVLTGDGAPPVQMRDVKEMNLRRGIDNEIELQTGQGVTFIRGPKSGKRGATAIWMALARDLIRALPEDATLVFRQKPQVKWLGYGVALLAAVGAVSFVVNVGVDAFALGLAALMLGGGLFLAWASGAFSGTITLDRVQTSDALDRMTVTLERLGDAAPGAGLLKAARLEAYRGLGRVSGWALEPDGDAPWPIEEAYRGIWTDRETVLVVTDGLTARYDDGRPGFKYELIMELPEVKEVDDFLGQPEFELFRRLVSKAIAFVDLETKCPTLVELQCNDSSCAHEDVAGMLIGTAAHTFEGWGIYPVLLLQPDELAHLKAAGDAAVADMAAAMAAAGAVSRPDRPPLI